MSDPPYFTACPNPFRRRVSSKCLRSPIRRPKERYETGTARRGRERRGRATSCTTPTAITPRCRHGRIVQVRYMHYTKAGDI